MWKQLLGIGLVGGGFSLGVVLADDTDKTASTSDSRPDKEAVVAEVAEVVEVQEVPSAERNGSRLWLGIALKSIEGDLAAYLGDDHGVLVDQVQPDSPAAKAGLKKGDVLLAVDGSRLRGPDDLLQIMQAAVKDKSIQLSVLRKSERLEISVTPAPRPTSAQFELAIPELAQGLEELGPFRFDFGGKPGEEKRLRMFRLADPSVIMTPKRAELKGDFKIHINSQLDGESVELTVSRTADQPAEIVVKRGDDVQKLTEKELDQLPESLRNLVQNVIGGESGGRLPFDLGQLGRVEELQRIPLPEEFRKLFEEDVQQNIPLPEEYRKLFEGYIQQLRERLADEGGKLSEKAQKDFYRSLRENVDQAREAAEKAREMARRNAEQAKEAAKEWSKEAEQQLKAGEANLKAQVEQALKEAEKLTQSEQIAELKRMIEQLRNEVEELRSGREEK